MKRTLKITIAGALLAAMLLVTASCGEICNFCEDSSILEETSGDLFMCQHCIEKVLI